MARKTSKRKSAQAAQVSRAVGWSRRDMLRMGRNGAIATVLLAGAGYAGSRWFAAYQHEHDLARIGQGKPAVVQVHDPLCPTCTALQRETKKAMKRFGECDLLYLVADIRQDTGAAFAAVHNVPHVTLVLLDGAGEVTQVLQGMRYHDEIEPILAGHFAAHGNGAQRS
ncbi:hypothetical protein [Sulfitobacter aestuariivivens]|uniref:Thioredoxin family protein n=1 Tax=Sulfitobacter aestuariivivens TaxID=2766981 RepID=A0A927D2B9_9RHOB|nr:hypothetical protein [Sulfitobacter aestuariivivens]MBD3662624.1 hypothetical protein [Sulfitobacter aestuariivivens]